SGAAGMLRRAASPAAGLRKSARKCGDPRVLQGVPASGWSSSRLPSAAPGAWFPGACASPPSCDNARLRYLELAADLRPERRGMPCLPALTCPRRHRLFPRTLVTPRTLVPTSSSDVIHAMSDLDLGQDGAVESGAPPGRHCTRCSPRRLG